MIGDKSLARSASVIACAAATLFASSAAMAAGNRNVVNDIVGQTSTGTVASGGNALYIPPKPQYSGVVGILMDYGANGAFVCSGTLINKRAIVTAAHCVSDGTAERPLNTTVFFYGGQDDPALYAAGSPADRIAVTGITVHQDYTGEVVDQNDIAVLKLGQDAPDYAPIYKLSNLTDLTGVDHIVAGYGARSIDGGNQGTLPGFSAGTGRLRYAGNRFDVRFGDADFQGYWNGQFGTAAVDHVWISDFDNGTEFRDGSCNIAKFESANRPDIFSNPVFSTSKYCDTGIGAFEGIGAGGDSGGAYFVDGKLAAVHSFAFWQRADESANRFGQLKGAVPVYHHRDFIFASIPEPESWALMIAGFGMVGAAMRGSRKRTTVRFA